MKNDVYQMVTDRIVSEMEKGNIPWQKPWFGSGAAINYVTRKPYSFLNEMLLGQPGEYLTFKQCKDCGGSVRKGAKSRIIVFYKSLPITKHDDETEEDKVCEIPFLRYMNVFHVDDCEGVESKLHETTENTLQPCERAENIVSGYLARETTLSLRRDKISSKACYSPCTDTVVVPCMKQYSIVEEFYSTLFHELTHSTGISSRCNREIEKNNGFGSESYSKEELVAEIGAAMLVNNSGLDSSLAFRNSVAYLQSWLRALKNDKRLIVNAAGKAEKAVRFVLGDL